MGYVRRILQADRSRDGFDIETLDYGFSRKQGIWSPLRACLRLISQPIHPPTPKIIIVSAPRPATSAPIAGRSETAAEEAITKAEAGGPGSQLADETGCHAVPALQDEKGGAEEEAEEAKAHWLVL